MLGLEGGDVIGQTPGLEPGPEPAHVPRVLRHRVRRTAVGLELGLEAGEGGGEAHGEDLGWLALGRWSPRMLRLYAESRRLSTRQTTPTRELAATDASGLLLWSLVR